MTIISRSLQRIKFRAHDVHSIKHKPDGFVIEARTWIYGSEQVKTLQEKRGARVIDPSLFPVRRVTSSSGVDGLVKGCIPEERIQSYLRKCFSVTAEELQQDLRLEAHILKCARCKNIADDHDFLVDALWACRRKVKTVPINKRLAWDDASPGHADFGSSKVDNDSPCSFR